MVRMYAAACQGLLPAAFVREYGAPLVEAFHDLYRREIGRAGGRRRLAHEFLSLVHDAVRSRSASRWPAPGGKGPRRARHLIEQLSGELRYGARALAHDRTFALTAIATLAIGIAVNTAMFTVVNAVLLRGPAYGEPDALVQISMVSAEFVSRAIPPGVLRDLRGPAAEVFEEMAALRVTGTPHHLQGHGDPELERVLEVAPAYFRVLGVAPLLGRTLEDADDVPGSAVVVISYGLWQRQFAGDPSVIGDVLKVGGEPQTVVGVMPEGFELIGEAFWQPLELTEELWVERRRSPGVSAIARLRGSTTLEIAQARLEALSSRLATEYPGTDSDRRIACERLQDANTAAVADNLWMLFGAVGLVLLLACTNIANLTMSRAVYRAREASVRVALGASRGRLARERMIESLMLAMAGGVAGIVLASLGARLLSSLWPAWSWFPRTGGFTVGTAVMAYALAISAAGGILFGAVPALLGPRTVLFGALNQARSGLPRRGGRVARSLVIVQAAVALLLLVGAGLLARSFYQLHAQPLGFETRGTVTALVTLPDHLYGDNDGRLAFLSRMLEEVEALPGVTAVAVTDNLPFGGLSMTADMELVDTRGAAPSAAGAAVSAQRHRVSGAYFDTLELPVSRGRPIRATDDAGAPPVAVVNETFARTYLPGMDPLGFGVSYRGTSFAIVGVVATAKHVWMSDDDRPAVYLSFYQSPSVRLFVAMRTSTDPAALAAPLRAAIRRLDPAVPLTDIATMDERLSGALAEPRFYAVVLGVFAITAVVLACVGLYGLLSYHVVQRSREMAIQIALGATAAHVLGRVMRQGLGLTVVGAAIGLLASLGLTRFLRSLLFEVTPTDATTLISVTALFLGLAAAASLVPARRTLRISPTDSLREE